MWVQHCLPELLQGRLKVLFIEVLPLSRFCCSYCQGRTLLCLPVRLRCLRSPTSETSLIGLPFQLDSYLHFHRTPCGSGITTTTGSNKNPRPCLLPLIKSSSCLEQNPDPLQETGSEAKAKALRESRLYLVGVDELTHQLRLFLHQRVNDACPSGQPQQQRICTAPDPSDAPVGAEPISYTVKSKH